MVECAVAETVASLIRSPVYQSIALPDRGAVAKKSTWHTLEITICVIEVAYMRITVRI